MEFNGIPLHPLVVHAAVVFTPLAALAAVVFVLVAKWRELLRWPAAVLVVVAAGTDWVARITGRNLFSKLTAQGLHNKWLNIHQQRANVLVWLVLGLAVVVVLAALTIPAGDRLARLQVSPAVVLGLQVVVVGVAVASLVYVYLTGDAGARSIWAPTS
jgi:uncharacterized membrane protein